MDPILSKDILLKDVTARTRDAILQALVAGIFTAIAFWFTGSSMLGVVEWLLDRAAGEPVVIDVLLAVVFWLLASGRLDAANRQHDKIMELIKKEQ